LEQLEKVGMVEPEELMVRQEQVLLALSKTLDLQEEEVLQVDTLQGNLSQHGKQLALDLVEPVN
jgi:hypothetical protein